MFKKLGTMAIMCCVIFTTFGVHLSNAQTDPKTGAIRAKVAKYGIGKKVVIRLRDNTKFKGKISSINQDSFSVRNSKTNTIRTFTYSEVGKINKKSYTKWIVIGAVAAAGVLAYVLTIGKICRNEGGNVFCQ